MPRNQGINIGGDGMGGRRGASRQWGFGDDSDGEQSSDAHRAGSVEPNSVAEGSTAAAAAPRIEHKKEDGLAMRNQVEENRREPANAAATATGNNMDEDEHRKIYERGLRMRTHVLGEEYVGKSLRDIEGNEFMRPFVQFATEAAWSTVWTRPGLELKTRSLLNLAMLTALGKWTEFETHVRGAVRNGATEVEIRETLLQATAYCGMPAGMEAFRHADKVLKDLKFRGDL